MKDGGARITTWPSASPVRPSRGADRRSGHNVQSPADGQLGHEPIGEKAGERRARGTGEPTSRYGGQGCAQLPLSLRLRAAVVRGSLAIGERHPDHLALPALPPEDAPLAVPLGRGNARRQSQVDLVLVVQRERRHRGR